VKKSDGTKYVGGTTADPLKRFGTNSSSPAPVINRDSTVANFDQYLDYLYDNHFEITEKNDLDPTANNNSWKFKWYNEYYHFGLSQAIMNASPYLEQTKGWNGLNGAGTFDPLP
jgi:hypothetical protein